MNIKYKIIKYAGILIIITSIIWPLIIIDLFSNDNNISLASTTGIIILSQIVILTIGASIYFKAKIISKQKFLKPKNLLLLILSLIICLLILEAVSRNVLSDTPYHSKNLFFTPYIFNHPKYGWVTAPNTTDQKEIKENSTNTRTVNVTYFNYGFKRWGSTQTNKTKVFIIGDSYTEAYYLNNGEEYYAYLEDEFENIELFVYGVANYGSLQEFMILDDFFDIIKPDLIIWQFCTNDYYNNYWKAGKTLFPYGVNRVRPYLEGEKIIYRLPGPAHNLRKISKLFDFLLTYYQKTAYKKNWGNLNLTERKIKNPLKNFNGMPLNVTIKIINMAKEKAGNTPFYFFWVNDDHPKELKKIYSICKKQGIYCINGTGDKLTKARRKKMEIINLDDGHYNIVGNRILGEFLVDYFKKNRIFENQKD